MFVERFDDALGKLIFIHEKHKIIGFGYKEHLQSKCLLKLLSTSLTNMYLDKANMRFKKLRIQNNLIESVEDNHFGEIEFKEIFIWDCENSKPID